MAVRTYRRTLSSGEEYRWKKTMAPALGRPEHLVRLDILGTLTTEMGRAKCVLLSVAKYIVLCHLQ